MQLVRATVPLLGLAAWLALAGAAHAVRCPNVMLVLDRSGSMDEDPAGTYPCAAGTSKWAVLQAAVKKIVTQYGDRMPFGLQMFTSSALTNLQCYYDAHIDVEPAHGTAQKIATLVMAARPDAQTNTGEAVERAANDPVMLTQTRGQYLVLITDGDPNCNSGDQWSGAGFTVSQIQNAASLGIHTFVVGFDGSGGVSPDNLNRMALAGMEPQPGCDGRTSPCYYSASNAKAFNDAIDKIVNLVTGGEFGAMACDDSCDINACDPGTICVTDEQNPAPHCVPDPCRGAACGSGSFCRNGACVNGCLNPCGKGRLCIDGACVVDDCFGKVCSAGQVCDQATGGCIVNQCIGKSCRSPLVCNPLDGACVVDECRVVVCPAGMACVAGGNCEAVPVDGGVGGNVDRNIGCDAAPSGGGAGSAIALAALLSAALLLASRRFAR